MKNSCVTSLRRIEKCGDHPGIFTDVFSTSRARPPARLSLPRTPGHITDAGVSAVATARRSTRASRRVPARAPRAIVRGDANDGARKYVASNHGALGLRRAVDGARRRRSRRPRLHRDANARVDVALSPIARRCEPDLRVQERYDKSIHVVPQRRTRDASHRRVARSRRARRMRLARRSHPVVRVGSSDRLPVMLCTRRDRCDGTPRASTRVDARHRVGRVHRRVFDASSRVCVVVDFARPSRVRVQNQVCDFGPVKDDENDASADGASRGLDRQPR